jgi:SAM-dependent methyltransferase
MAMKYLLQGTDKYWPAKQHHFARSLVKMEKHYERLFRRYGDTPDAADWDNRETRERRFAVLSEVAPLAEASVLDFGCGTGELLGYLLRNCRFHGEYTGWDLSEPLLEAARAKFPGVRFQRREILSEGIQEDFDYILVSGTFNTDFGQAESFMREAIQLLFRHARKALAFNLLSIHAETHNAGLYYASPETVFDFCRTRLSPRVTVRHDYRLKPGIPPYDFTVYVYHD